MSKIAPCLWFDGEAEEAARFYVSLLPDSRVDVVSRYPVDTPGGKAGETMMVEFTLAGQPYLGLNGGPYHRPNLAVSLSVLCEDQSEVDRLWEALTADGGEGGQCGWLTDRYGFSWQITPRRLIELVKDENGARASAAMEAMMAMGKIDIAAIERAASRIQ